MDSLHEDQRVGATAGVRDWASKPTAATAERVPAAENRILRAQLPKRLRLTDPQRSTLAEIGKRLGRKALEHVACVAKPDTILGWYRRLIAQKFDGSQKTARIQGDLRSGARSAN